jgi:hypothetical protein
MTMRRKKTLRRATAIGLAILSAALLAACQPTGFDPGMNTICFATGHQGLPNSYADPRECQGGVAQAIAKGNYWWLGSNSPEPKGSCGDSSDSLAYPIDGPGSNHPGSPLSYNSIRAKTPLGYTGVVTELNIRGDACADNTEISFGFGNGRYEPLVGPGNATLKSVHSVAMVSRSGVNHVAVILYMTDMDNGARHTLTITVPPGSYDPRDSDPFPGVRTIATPEPGHNLVVLSGAYFNLPPGGPKDGWSTFTLDWRALLGWLQNQAANHPKDLAGWSDLWGRLNRQSTTIEVEAQTLGNGSRMDALASNFTMYY